MNAKRPEISPPRSARLNVPQHTIEELLATHPFLRGMTVHHRRILTDCAMLTHFAPGEMVFREGDPANRFYLISGGRVSIESYVRDRGAVVIDTVGAGDILGWSWLFPPYYWHFDARAIEPTDAVFFYGTPLRDECDTDHSLGYELMKRMSEVLIKRLQSTRRQLLESRGLGD